MWCVSATIYLGVLCRDTEILCVCVRELGRHRYKRAALAVSSDSRLIIMMGSDLLSLDRYEMGKLHAGAPEPQPAKHCLLANRIPAVLSPPVAPFLSVSRLSERPCVLSVALRTSQESRNKLHTPRYESVWAANGIRPGWRVSFCEYQRVPPGSAGSSPVSVMVM